MMSYAGTTVKLNEKMLKHARDYNFIAYAKKKKRKHDWYSLVFPEWRWQARRRLRWEPTWTESRGAPERSVVDSLALLMSHRGRTWSTEERLTRVWRRRYDFARLTERTTTERNNRTKREILARIQSPRTSAYLDLRANSADATHESSSYTTMSHYHTIGRSRESEISCVLSRRTIGSRARIVHPPCGRSRLPSDKTRTSGTRTAPT